MTTCDSLLKALKTCKDKHKIQADIVCRDLNQRTTWCLVEEICPDEVYDLRACCGSERGGIGAWAKFSPPNIPSSGKCQRQVIKLESCLVSHSDENGGEGEK
jgi:hypothetical protein